MIFIIMVLATILPYTMYATDLSAQFAGGGAITITSPGSYTIAGVYTIDSLSIMADNVSLIGQPNTLIEITGGGTGITIDGRQGIRVEGLTINDARDSPTPLLATTNSTNVVLSGITIENISTSENGVIIVGSSFVSVINTQVIDYSKHGIIVQSRQNTSSPLSSHITFDSLTIDCNSSCTAVRFIPVNGGDITNVQFLGTTNIHDARHGIVVDTGTIGSVASQGVGGFGSSINGLLPALEVGSLHFHSIDGYFIINGSRTTNIIADTTNFDGLTSLDDIERQLAHGCTNTIHPFGSQGTCNDGFPLQLPVISYETPGQGGLSFDYLNHPSGSVGSIKYTPTTTKTLTVCIYRINGSGGVITGTVGPTTGYPQTTKIVTNAGCMSFDTIPATVSSIPLLLNVGPGLTISSDAYGGFPISMNRLTTLNPSITLSSPSTAVGIVFSGSIENSVPLPTPGTPISGPSGGGGGGGGGLAKDICPQGDASPSYYDGRCDNPANPQSHNPQSGNTGSVIPGPITPGLSTHTKQSLYTIMNQELTALKQSRHVCQSTLPHFTDLIFDDTQGHQYASHIASLVARCAIWGQGPHRPRNTPNRFRPNDPIRFGEFVKILVNTLRNREGKQSLTDFSPVPSQFRGYTNLSKTHRSMPYLADAASRGLLKEREIPQQNGLAIPIDRELTDTDIIALIKQIDPRIQEPSSGLRATRGYAVYLTTTLLGMTDDRSLLTTNTNNLRLWTRINKRLQTMDSNQQRRFLVKVIDLFRTTQPSQWTRLRIDSRALANKFSAILSTYDTQ